MSAQIGSLHAELSADSAKFERGMQQSAVIVDRTVRKLEQLGKSVESIGSRMERIGARLSQTLTAPLASVGGAVVKFAGEFDRAMVQSLAIMGPVSDQLRAQMEGAARAIGTSTVFAADQAAGAYYYLASAGLSAQQSMAALPQVAAFAQAGMFDLEKATEYLLDSQKALGLSSTDVVKNADQLARVADVLTQAANASNASIQQFAESLASKAGAQMRTFNISVEQGVAVLAAYADQGVKGSLAGERFDILVRELTKNALEHADAFRQVGISVFDSQGRMQNLADIIAQLEQAFGGMSDKQKVATLDMLGFRAESQGAILALLGLSGKIRDYEGQLRSAGGASAAVAAKQLETPMAQFELLKKQFVDVGIELGKALLPVLTRVGELVKSTIVPAMRTAVDAFKALPPAAQMAAFGVGAVALAAGPLLFVGGAVAQSVGGAIVMFTKLGLASKLASLGLVSTGAAGTGASGALATFASGAGTALTSTTALSVGAAAVGGVIGATLGSALLDAGDKLRGLSDPVREGVAQVGLLEGAWILAKDAIGGLASGIWEMASKVASGLAKAFGQFFKNEGPLAEAMSKRIKQVWDGLAIAASWLGDRVFDLGRTLYGSGISAEQAARDTKLLADASKIAGRDVTDLAEATRLVANAARGMPPELARSAEATRAWNMVTRDALALNNALAAAMKTGGPAGAAQPAAPKLDDAGIRAAIRQQEEQAKLKKATSILGKEVTDLATAERVLAIASEQSAGAQKKAAKATNEHAEAVAKLKAAISGAMDSDTAKKLKLLEEATMARAGDALGGAAGPPMLESLSALDLDRAIKELEDLGDAAKKSAFGLALLEERERRLRGAKFLLGHVAPPTAAPRQPAEYIASLGTAREREAANFNPAYAEMQRGIQERFNGLISRAVDFRGVISSLREAFEVFGIAAGSALGKTMGVLGGALEGGQRLGDAVQQLRAGWRIASDMDAVLKSAGAAGLSFVDKLKFSLKTIDWSSVVQGVAQVVGAFKQALDQGSAFARGISGAMVGAQAGGAIGQMFGGEVGKQIGQVFGAVGGAVVAALHKPGWKRAMEDVGRSWGVSISEGVARQIDKDAKRLGDRTAAALVNMGSIFKEAGGVAAYGVESAMAKVHDLFSAVERKQVSLREAGKVFDEVFTDIAQAAKDKNGLVSKSFLDMVALAKRFGVESEKMREFSRAEAQSFVSGLSAGLKGSTLASQGAASGIGAAIVAQFNELRKDMPISEVLKQLGDVIGAFREQLEKTGFDGGAAFAQIESYAALAKDEIAGPALDAINGYGNAMAALHNQGLLNQGTFAGLAEQITLTYRALEEQGKGGPAALQMMQPELQRMWELQQDFGYAVDEGTQKLLAEAEAAGVVGDAHRDAQDRIAASTDRIAQVLEAMAKKMGVDLPEAARKGAAGIEDAFGRVDIKPIEVPYSWRQEGVRPPIPGAPDMGDLPSFADGGVGNFGSGTLAVLHGLEAIIPLDMLRAAPATTGQNMSVSLQYSPQLTFQGAGNDDEIRRVVGESLRDNADDIAARVEDLVVRVVREQV